MIAPLKAALTAEDAIREPKRSNVREVDVGSELKPVKRFEEFVASSDGMKLSLVIWDGESTVVGT